MRRVLVVLVLAATMVGAAAGAIAATGSDDAFIAGDSYACGGPPPGRCSTQPWVWVVVRAHHHLVAEQKSDRHGWFHFTLMPGRYKVRLKGLLYTTKTVTATAGRTAHVKLDYSIP